MKKALAPLALVLPLMLAACSTTEQQVSTHIETLAANPIDSAPWQEAVAGLAQIGRPAARQLVAHLNPAYYRGPNYREYRDEMEKIRSGCALALGRIRHTGGAGSLKDRVGAAYRTSERLASIWALGEIGFVQAAADAITAQLTDEDPQIRLYSAVALVKMDDMSGESVIVDVLNGGDAALAAQAVEALQETNYHGVELLSRLKAADGPLKDSQRRNQIGGALETIKTQLIAQLADEDPDQRRRSARALGKISDDAVRQALLGLLQDPSNRVRFNAAASLAEVGSAEGITFLFDALENPDPILRVNAVTFLGEVQQNTGTVKDQLVAALTAVAPLARAGAAQVLGQSRVADAVPALIKATSDDVAQVRWNAVIALGRIAAPQSRPHLQTLLDDADQTVAYYAEWALHQLDRS